MARASTSIRYYRCLPPTSLPEILRHTRRARLAAVQIDLFPIKPIVEVMDPRKVVGESTSVEHLVRVKFRPNDAPHLVFHDRHGWYCESHGPACPSVKLAQDASG